MIDPRLLSLLVCPENRTPLRPAEEGLLERVNAGIRAGTVCRCNGQTVSEPLEGGLIRADGQILYPIRDGIPAMLADEAIVLGPLASPQP